jgi:hypothetical protein
MLSTITSKPNHYERLGLPPSASDQDIAQAFAREISPLRPRSVADMAQITLAYETLRNPIKRRAYDASLLPEPEPAPEPLPEPAPSLWPAGRDGWPFIASARIGSAELPAIDTLPRPTPRPEPFVVPARRESVPRPDDDRSLQALFEDRYRLVDGGPREWKRPAAIVGGMFLTVGLVGAGLGWYASRDIEPARAEAATPAVARPPAPAVAGPPTVTRDISETRPERRTGSVAAGPGMRRTPPRPRPTLSEEQPAEEIPDIPTEQVVAQASPVAAAPAAAMPLPNSVVARTIGRIGYSCGEVASTTAVEGASGVFKVTCTSGDSYRAAPVGGRYRFKRWSGR